MKTHHKILICMLTFIITAACAFVQNMIFPSSEEIQTGETQNHIVPAAEAQNPVVPAVSEAVNTVEPIVCDDDNCIPACLDRLDEVLQTMPFASIGNSIYEEEGAEFNLVVYKVKGDEIVDPAVLYVPSEYRKYQEDTASHQRVWDFYVAVTPAELRQSIDEFIIYTDGTNGDSSAWVAPSPREEGMWQVGIDLLESDYPVYLAETLLHETAHMLTLDTAQIQFDDHYYYYDEKQDSFLECEQYVLDGGCSLPDSYINRFYQKFWKDSYAEWWKIEQEAQDTETFDEYLEIMEQFYDMHEDWFLNSYAATSLEEDIAESFSFFALNPNPAGDAVYEQKIAFFYEFPELVEYRQQIIKGLCSYIQ